MSEEDEDLAFATTACTCKIRCDPPHHEQTCAKYVALYRLTRISLATTDEDES